MDLKVLHKISYGVYVIASKRGDEINGLVANSVIQTSADPATISVCLNRDNYTNRFIEESGVFTISILEEDTPMDLIGNFGFHSGRDRDKFAEVEYGTGKTGTPFIKDHSVGYIEAEVVDSVDVETHTIFICKLVNAESFNDKDPMTYAYYHQVKNGKSPKSAPTYIKEEIESEYESGKYQCEVCGYIYDPAKGDPDNGIEVGTSFADLPDDWVCPLCGVGKDQFKEI